MGHELLHDMLADLPPEQAADEAEFMARLGQFSLLNPAERAAVLAARTRSVRDQLAHLAELTELASAPEPAPSGMLAAPALPAIRNTALARD